MHSNDYGDTVTTKARQLIIFYFLLLLLFGGRSAYAASCTIPNYSDHHTIDSVCSNGLTLTGDYDYTLTVDANVTDTNYTIPMYGYYIKDIVINSGKVLEATNSYPLRYSNGSTDSANFNSLTNNGTISSNGYGIMMDTWQGSGTTALGTFTNNGIITTKYASIYSATGTSIENLVNTGTLTNQTSQQVIIVAAGSSITDFTNTGTLAGNSGDGDDFGNSGTVTNFSNKQGKSTTNPVRYIGILPTNSKIIIDSTSDYGQIRFSSISGATTFSIDTTNSASEAFISNATYNSVLSGITSAQISKLSGTSGTLVWTLTDDNDDNTWDLRIDTETETTMVITSAEVSDGDASGDATLALTFTSSEATANFVVGDIMVTNATLSGFSETSSTVYTATLTPTGEATVTVDVAAGTFTNAASYSNTAATQFNWTYDSSSPTMAITSAEVTDGGASDHATLALTFTSSEATTNFVKGDITVTNATLSSLSATSSTVYTVTLTPTGEGAVTVDVAAGTFTDAASNNNTAATQFNWTHLLDPTTKVDVTGSIKASINMASQWTQSTFSTISNRLGWLKSHKGQSKTSYQGIRLDFNDATINTLMAAPSASFFDTNWTNAAVDHANRSNDSLSTLGQNVVMDASKAALNEAAIVRQNATGTLNPAFKPIYNGWSIWTDGTVTIGDVDATATSAKQSSKDYSISIGLDKPLDDHRLVGFVLRTGQGSVDVGTSTSKVKSESYSLAGYSAYEGYQNLLIEAVAGVGVVKYNLTRADGVHTLNGGRAAHQAFASLSASKPATVFGKLSLSPFVKATYNHTSFGAYSESGGFTALTYKAHSLNETQLALGTDVRYQLFIGNNDVHPYARVSYSLDVSDQANAPAQMYYNSNPSKVYSLGLDTRNTASAQLSLGADLVTMGGVNASLGYLRNTVMNSGYSQSVSLRVGQAF